MEPFEIECPHCRKRLRVRRPALVGRQVRCPKCRRVMRVERPLAAAAVQGMSADSQTEDTSEDELSFDFAATPEGGFEVSSFDVRFQGGRDDGSGVVASPMGPADQTRPEKRPVGSSRTMILAAAVSATVGLILGFLILAYQGYFGSAADAGRSPEGTPVTQPASPEVRLP